jgi:hypothetical protein
MAQTLETIENPVTLDQVSFRTATPFAMALLRCSGRVDSHPTSPNSAAVTAKADSHSGE